MNAIDQFKINYKLWFFTLMLNQSHESNDLN